jgi:hypothetical protein
MELSYDWRRFHSLFYPKRKTGVPTAALRSGPAYLVVNEEIILAAFSESEDLSDWIGRSFQEISEHINHRELVLFDRTKVEEWVHGSLTYPHFYEQVEEMRQKISPQVLSNGKIKDVSMETLIRRHFLLDAIKGWWSKLFPTNYGIFIRLEGKNSQDFFLVVRKGRVESFRTPDLNSLDAERRVQPAALTKYLSEKYLVPVQSCFVPAEEWATWTESSEPWKLVATAIKSGKLKLHPFKWSWVFLVATRTYFGV